VNATDRRLGERVMRRLDELALDTDEPGRITRLFLSPAHARAMDRVQRWMEEAGLNAHRDPIGNVVGRLACTNEAAMTFILGSHIDSVRDAGRYDGCFGVLAAIEVVEDIRRGGARLPFAIEVVAFGDEEGVRFPTTLSGSRALAGTFSRASLSARDPKGVSLGEALRSFGCDTGAIASVARSPHDVCGYLEAHIEQGPVLEVENLALGVVTAISGCSRLKVVVSGEAGHAGTVPMSRRKDAMAGAAEMILAVERQARGSADVVATVGVIDALPGAINVIPAQAHFSIDLRAPTDASRHRAVAAIEGELHSIASERQLGLAVTPNYDAAAVACDAKLVAALSQALERQGHRPFALPSGAGHDAMAMASLCPVVMLFVRCKGGISHNPAEAITVEDAGAVIRVIRDFLLHYEVPSSKAIAHRMAAR